MTIERFEDLKSWQEARKLACNVYEVTKREAFESDRGLRWQIREAAISSMSNIAEAHGRYSFEDKRRFLDISLGSCKEVQSQLYVALDQTYIGPSKFAEVYQQAEIAARLITGTLDNLERQIAQRSPHKPGPRRRA